MSMINRVPKGFLGLLDAKVMGRSPALVQDQLQPGLDMTALYLADITLQSTSATVGGAALVGNFAPVVIPAGEQWFVYAINSLLTCTIAGTAGVRFSYRLQPFSAVFIFGDTFQVNAAIVAGEQAATTSEFSQPLILTGGTTISTQLMAPKGGTYAITTTVLQRRVVV